MTRPEDAARLTDSDLDAMARGENWRDVTCSRCGKKRITTPEIQTFACTCLPDAPHMTRTGPTLHERAATELRAARALLADLRAQGVPTDEHGNCVWCGGAPVESPGEEPRYRHRQVSGKTCVGERIERG